MTGASSHAATTPHRTQRPRRASSSIELEPRACRARARLVDVRLRSGTGALGASDAVDSIEPEARRWGRPCYDMVDARRACCSPSPSLAAPRRPLATHRPLPGYLDSRKCELGGPIAHSLDKRPQAWSIDRASNRSIGKHNHSNTHTSHRPIQPIQRNPNHRGCRRGGAKSSSSPTWTSSRSRAGAVSPKPQAPGRQRWRRPLSPLQRRAGR